MNDTPGMILPFLLFWVWWTYLAPVVSATRRECTFHDVRQCLTRRSVLVIGTSVSRHWHFAIQSALSFDGGRASQNSSFVHTMMASSKLMMASSYRKNEQILCGGGRQGWNPNSPTQFFKQRCTHFAEGTQTLLVFQWAAPFIEVSVIEEAVQALFAAAAEVGLNTSSFAAIVNGGLELAINMKDASIRPEATVVAMLPNILGYLDPIENVKGSVCWRLSTQVCCVNPTPDKTKRRSDGRPFYDAAGCFNGQTDVSTVQQRLAAGNLAIARAINEIRPAFRVLDAWSMTPHTFCETHYEDFVHAPSLVYEQIEAWIRDILRCPCSGPLLNLSSTGPMASERSSGALLAAVMKG